VPTRHPHGPAPHSVFIVDDDAAVRRALALLASSAGYQAHCFTSGEAFVESSGNLPPGCAVVDVAMPGLDGPGVLAALRQKGNPMPIIFVTAHDRPAVHRQLLEGGGRRVLLKPVDPAALLDEIRGSLEGEPPGAPDLPPSP
jgi:FixJ family two-component response regulator